MNSDLLTKYQRLTGVRLNMIVDENLQFTGNNKSSRSISNPTDRALLSHLRSLSDLVITDASTAFVEGYRQSKVVPIDIWSESGNFRGMQKLEQDGANKPMAFSKIADVASALRERTARQQAILLETGPTLSRKLAEFALIDEVCLTVANVTDLSVARQVSENFCEFLTLSNFRISQLIESRGSAYIRLNRSNGVA